MADAVEQLQAALAAERRESERWHKAHDAMLSEAARMVEEAKQGAEEALAAKDAEVERQRQAMARLSAPGIDRAPWFYAPCPECGAIEGMGLATPRVDGAILRDQVSVWCASCEHYGPGVPRQDDVNATDRAAVISWNREYAESFAAGKSAEAALASAKRETEHAKYVEHKALEFGASMEERAEQAERELEQARADLQYYAADRIGVWPARAEGSGDRTGGL